MWYSLACVKGRQCSPSLSVLHISYVSAIQKMIPCLIFSPHEWPYFSVVGGYSVPKQTLPLQMMTAIVTTCWLFCSLNLKWTCPIWWQCLFCYKNQSGDNWRWEVCFCFKFNLFDLFEWMCTACCSTCRCKHNFAGKNWQVCMRVHKCNYCVSRAT